MHKVTVPLGSSAYDILIAPGSVLQAGQHLRPFLPRGKTFIVSEQQVAAHWLGPLIQSLESDGISVQHLVLPPGESTKNWAYLEQLTDWLIENEVERDDAIIALGGGVIGDLTGFAAAILKRGCRFVQIPTTLLAQVDSSVGGKTAINSRAGKNLVGAFHQPSFVLIDPLVLNTLPDRDLRAGYAEVVKYGLINDVEFFTWCEANAPAVLARDPAALSHAIRKSVASKAAIVAADETERTGTRALLNLGHTFGHALEAETGFSDTLVHGEAVAAGMALAFAYSVRIGLCPEKDAERVTDHLRSAGLPFSLRSALVGAGGEQLCAHMLHDKKVQGGKLPFLLARGIGQTFLARDVDLSDVAVFLDGAE